MGMTAIEKALAAASGRDAVAPGDIVHPRPEIVIVHDGYVAAAKSELDSLGIDRVFDPERVAFVTDHDVLYTTPAAALRGQAIRKAAREWGISKFFDAGQGGHGHIFPMETGLVRPGMFGFAYDMHCTNFGAIGALILRNGSEVPTVLATGTIWTLVPHSIKVNLSGRLRPGVYARDVGFRLSADLVAQRWGFDHDYRALEFAGDGLLSLPVGERIALCNSVTEIGVSATMFPADTIVHAWREGLGLVRAEGYAADPDARYEAEIEINLRALAPQVALPGGPANAEALSSVAGRKIQHAYIGSCGSGSYSDLEVAARILSGRRVSEGTRLIIVPGTTGSSRRMMESGIGQIFSDAGAMVLPAGCGPCAGGGAGLLAPGETSICTAATNTAGRMGSKEADIFLASVATVAASAVAGEIVDPSAMLAAGEGR